MRVVKLYTWESILCQMLAAVNRLAISGSFFLLSRISQHPEAMQKASRKAVTTL